MPKTTPDQTSSDYDQMLPFWEMVETILSGATAMRRAGEPTTTAGFTTRENPYLPRFPNETDADYKYRKAGAKFTNIYADIVANLASKPFAEEVALREPGDRFAALAEDIDGRGNNLNVFAQSVFFGGVNHAIDWIFVDYTKARRRADGRVLSIAEEREQGLRPYWVRVPAVRMLAVYADTVRGQEIITHARMRETVTRRDGFEEAMIERIRILNREPVYEVLDDGTTTGVVVDYAPATYEVWERRQAKRAGTQWEIVEAGPVTIGVIPLVPFITGRRQGSSWRFIPPLQDAAYLQVEHFQQETGLKSIKELTAFPMLAGNGVQPEMEGGKATIVPVGPRTVLYAPPYGDNAGQHGEWQFIEPTAESLKFLAEDVKNTEQQLRELGRQPLTASAGITQVAAAMASQKASSAVQAWAFGLKDALEQAFVLTAKWINQPNAPEVSVYTDFSIDMQDENGPKSLMEMRKNGDLSQETLWEEHKRRGILSGDFDVKQERKRLEEEIPDPLTDEEMLAGLTPPGKSEPDPDPDEERDAA